MNLSRGDVYLVRLDPVLGAEMKKTRPCVLVSPDEIHRHCRTCIVAPFTSALRGVSWRVQVQFTGRDSEVAMDHMRSVDKGRLVKRLGRLTPSELRKIFQVLAAMFA